MNSVANPDPLAKTINPKPAESVTSPTAAVPPQVRTSIEMDNKKYSAQNTTPPEPKANFTTKLGLDKLKQSIPWRKVLKVTIIMFTLIILCFGSLLFFTVTNLDTSIIKITLTGKVTDRITGDAVNGAEIYINDELKGKTTTNGVYTINGLDLGTVNIKIKTEDYQEINQEIPINRLFLNYTTKRDFELTPKEKAAIEGRVVVDNEEYRFIDERIIIEETEHKLNIDGTFRIQGITVGRQQFNLKSLNYKDFTNNIDVKPGINQLQEIKLLPAGDIEGSLLSYVREDIVSDINFNIENLSPDQTEINNDKFKIRDLEVGREYTIQPTAEGYKSRSYKITIKQGLNQIFDFRLVEEGKAVYYKSDSETGRNQFFSADYDGKNLTKLTSFERNTNIFSYYFDLDSNKLFFQTDRDRISSGSGGGTVRAVYELDLNSQKETRLTQNTNGLGTITPSYKAKKLISTSRVRVNNTNQNNITVMDFAGNNRIDVKTTPNTITSTLITDDGRYIFINDKSSTSANLYRIDLTNKSESMVAQSATINLFDATSDGNQVLFDRTNSQTTFLDLTLYNFSGNEFRTLNDNHDGLEYIFLDEDNNQYVYLAQRDGRTNLFKYIIDQNRDDKLTNISAGDKVEDIFRQGNYFYYTTKSSLYVIDITKPLNYKVVFSL